MSATEKKRKLSDTTAAINSAPEDIPQKNVTLSHQSEPIIDPEVALTHVQGNEELLRDMVGIFFEECDIMIANLEKALAGHDAELIERAAHTLKSSSAMFGAKRARAAAFDLAVTGKSEDISKAPEQFARLRSELDQLRQAVDQQWGEGAG